MQQRFLIAMACVCGMYSCAEVACAQPMPPNEKIVVPASPRLGSWGHYIKETGANFDVGAVSGTWRFESGISDPHTEAIYSAVVDTFCSFAP